MSAYVPGKRARYRPNVAIRDVNSRLMLSKNINYEINVNTSRDNEKDRVTLINVHRGSLLGHLRCSESLFLLGGNGRVVPIG
jgi:hypothetical protein